MPSGKTHDRITLLTCPVITGLTYALTQKEGIAGIVAGSYLFSGFMFGPDLDIYSIQYKRWGWLRGLWLPYQTRIRHRSWLSHGVIVGTTLRVLYLATVLLILALPTVAIAQFIWGFDWNWQIFAQKSFNLIINQYPQEAIALWIGLEMGAMSHSLSDWLVSGIKRTTRKRLNKHSKTPKTKKRQKTRK